MAAVEAPQDGNDRPASSRHRRAAHIDNPIDKPDSII